MSPWHSSWASQIRRDSSYPARSDPRSGATQNREDVDLFESDSRHHLISLDSTDTCGARGNFCRLWVLLLAPDANVLYQARGAVSIGPYRIAKSVKLGT